MMALVGKVFALSSFPINRHEDFYQEACARTRQVILLMERIREDAGITFAENCYQC